MNLNFQREVEEIVVMKYTIQVLIPTTLEWVVVEVGVKAIEQIKRQVGNIKRIYPEYQVRALDGLGSRTLVAA